MSYTDDDYAADQYYLEISKELYPEHKAQAIAEFTKESLHSFYIQNPFVMLPAVHTLQEGVALRAAGHNAAAVVFFVSAIELFLKATILKPVVYGLVNHSGLADIIVDHATGGTGFARYCGFRRRRTPIPKGTRTAFRAEGEQFSERSDAGTSIVQEVFGFVKRNLSGAQRRKSAASGERGADSPPVCQVVLQG